MSELVLAPFVQVDRQLIARCELGVAALRRVADIVAVVARGQVALAKAGARADARDRHARALDAIVELHPLGVVEREQALRRRVSMSDGAEGRRPRM